LLGQRIINLCHGVWSIGLLLTSLLGTLLRANEVGVGTHLALLVLPAIALVAAIVGPAPAAPPRDHTGAAKRRILSLPTPRVLALVGFLLGATLLEVAARNWSVIFMRDAFAAPAWVDTLALPAFLIAQASGRIFADGWSTRYGPVRVGQVLTLVALLGLVTVVLSPSLPMALIGFLLIGVGVCAAFPSAASAAARLGDRPSSENVASLTLATQLILLTTPALLGYISDTSGPRAMYAIALPLLVLGFFFARALQPDDRKAMGPAAPVAAK
jgi:MFS family permease